MSSYELAAYVNTETFLRRSFLQIVLPHLGRVLVGNTSLEYMFRHLCECCEFASFHKALNF